MTTFTIIHGPKASGKTFHAEAFRRHYGCHASIDLDDLPKLDRRRTQLDGLLILTYLKPDDALKCIRKLVPEADDRIIDIKTARLAIGVSSHAPMRMKAGSTVQ